MKQVHNVYYIDNFTDFFLSSVLNTDTYTHVSSTISPKYSTITEIRGCRNHNDVGHAFYPQLAYYISFLLQYFVSAMIWFVLTLVCLVCGLLTNIYLSVHIVSVTLPVVSFCVNHYLLTEQAVHMWVEKHIYMWI